MPGWNARLLASGFLLALFSSVGQTFFIALFGGEIRASFSLTHGTFGTLYSLATLGSGCAMFWLGAALDRTSLLGYSVAALAMLTIACVMLASAESMALLVLAFFGLRLAGQGMLSHASVTGMARSFMRHRGKAIAFATLGHPAGEAALPVTIVAATALLGWRQVWFLAAGLLIFAAAVIFWLLRRGEEPRPLDKQPHRHSEIQSYTVAEVLSSLRFYLITPALVSPSFVMTGLVFHQAHLTETKGWELAWFASAFAGYAATSTGAVILSGILTDRLSAVRVMPFHLLPLCLGCLFLGASDHYLIAAAFLSLAGATMGSGRAVATAMWAEIYGLRHLGAIRALGASLIVFSSALAPAVMGWLIDAGTSIEAIALGCAAALVSANLLLVIALRTP